MRHNLVMLVSCLVCALTLNFTSCKEENTETLYKGTVVNSVDKRPFENLEIKVTDGKNINAVEHTDSKGFFSILVRYNEINRSYYLLIGDTSCVPVKREFKGFGQAEIDLGTIEVEGPKVPTVKTFEPTDITPEGATVGGDVTDDGRATVTERGICYSTEEYPALESGKHTVNGSGKGEFAGTLTELEHNTTYYVRAYAKNRIGTSYGKQYSFTTGSGEAEVVTDSVYAITAVSAKCAGTVVADGGYKVTARGVCWAKNPDPTTTDYIANEGSGKGEFACAMRNLDINTTYYVRAFATNEVGTVYGEQVKIQTLDGMAVVVLDSIKDITATSATAYSTVTYDCDIAVTERGVCWSTTQYPTADGNHVVTGRGMGSYVSSITKLEYGTKYYVRAYATNSTGTAYSEQLTFSASEGLAKVTTTAATNVTATGATCGGNVTDDGTLTVTARGVCYGTTQYPTIDGDHTTDGKGKGTFTSTLKNLLQGTNYYYRAYATTAAGTVYGEQKSFKTTDGMAKVTTAEATNITAISATVGGNVTDDGTMTVTARGVCYGTTQYPTIDGEHTTDGKGLGEFTSSLNNLKDKTKYFYRAYATTAAGTAYGEQKTFTTADGSAAVTLGEVSNIKAASAIWTAEVTGNGGLSITERGICYSTSQYPTIDASHVATGSGMGAFTTTITSLSPNTQYYVRAYATNAVGTVYSEQKSFTTLNGLPSVSTSAISSVTASSAQGGGEVTDDGGFTVSAYGLCWGKASNPTIDGEVSVDGKGKAKFTHNITGLSANTTYYVRAYATNEIGTSYGENQTFTTTDGKATITTAKVTNITALTATCGGTVGETGGGTIKAVGVCWATTQNPTISNSHTTDGSSTGSFTSNLTGLKPNTKYYIRAYVTTNVTTTYGEQETFTTQSGLAELTTTTATSTSNTLSSGGKITSDGGYAITARGICYSTSNSSPDLKDKFTTDGKGLGEYTSYVSGLSANTTYYIRAYATNQIGTAYGNAITIKTKNGAASIKLGTVSNITALTASCSVTVSDAGGATLQSCGICWSTTQNPTITDNKTAGGNQLGTAYNCNMSALTPNTTYYVRGYATTDVTITYSEQISFKTATGLPVLTTAEPTATSTTITTGGNITSDGGYSITARGVCYSTSNSTPTIADSYTTAGIGTGSFSTTITNVSVSTTYYIRAYATNSIGTSYGEVKTVTTGNGLPIVTTTIIGENVTETTAISGGNVTDDGGSSVTARGVCWNTVPYPTVNDNKTTDGSGIGYYSSTITEIDLTSSNTYYVRAYATNKNGTSYGEQVLVSKENWDYKTLPAIEYGDYIYRLYPDCGAMTWGDAKQACENLVFGGYDDWMLPETKELMIHIMTNWPNGWKSNDGTHDWEYGFGSSDQYWTNEVSSKPIYVWYCSSCNPHVTYRQEYGWESKRVRPIRKYKATK